MQTGILASTDVRSEELRYVTTHFKDLQGLRLAPIWAAFLALSSVALSIHYLLLWQRATAGLAIILLGVAWLIWSKGWYERRYGVVQSPEPVLSSGSLSILQPEPQPLRAKNYSGVPAVYLLLMAFYIVPMLFSQFDRRSGTILGVQAVIFLILPRCLYPTSGLVLVRLRRTLSIAGSVVICAVQVSYLFERIGKWSYLTTICAVLMLLDLYDHWLFTRLLNGGPAEHSYE